MKKYHFYSIPSTGFLALFFMIAAPRVNAQIVTIPINTESYTILLQTDRNNILKTVYFGELVEAEAVPDRYRVGNGDSGDVPNSVYTPSGTWSLSEPAIQLTHSDGNTSLELEYVSHSTTSIENNIQLTSILLRDPVYPVEVTLHYKVYMKENLIEQWAEIKHSEEGPVKMQKYSSADLFFTGSDFYLTTFHNQWANEMQPNESRLTKGTKVFDSKLGARAMLLQTPDFIISFGQPASEHEGMVILGQLAWSGNFKLEFEIDTYDNLRFISGINPYASEYSLDPDQIFKTPSLIYAISGNGTGEASRNMHDWARKYRVLDGEGERLTLLNNWEATYFDFDENKLTGLFKGAKELGVDLFLLDDGWFGNKYPRNNDRAGLGDWQPNVKKLPDGVAYLVKEAKKEGVKFGIWIEPEMVNPKSELYENHIDWVIREPERPEFYFRNQLVLDMSNPEVQDFVFGIVDGLFTENPELAFIKWDCNSVIYNAHSEYLKKNGLPQSHLYVEYVKGLYKVLERLRAKYPEVPMMLCSGGGGRADYELLKYFTEFWPSDNTDPLRRIFIQWNNSYFFPSIAVDNHVTNWGGQSIKYKVDVASMGKLGFDIRVDELSENDLVYCKEAIANYHSFKEIVWHGDLYRLVNPYENDIAALMYVKQDKSKAIVFNYLVNNLAMNTNTGNIRLDGLDADKQYKVREINLYPGTNSRLSSGQNYSGDFLMKIGLDPNLNQRRQSVVLELTEVKE